MQKLKTYFKTRLGQTWKTLVDVKNSKFKNYFFLMIKLMNFVCIKE